MKYHDFAISTIWQLWERDSTLYFGPEVVLPSTVLHIGCLDVVDGSKKEKIPEKSG